MIASVESVRLGAELPQIVHAPPDVASYAAGEDAIALANAYLFDDPARLSPSQELRLRNGMATRADGKWAASRVGDFGGRQGAGKTDTIIARILSGVLLNGHKLIIYTAHEFPTANEIFLRLGGVFGGWDDLASLVQHERKAHGDQGFELYDDKRGIDCRILIKTRTGKSGRGFAKADLIIYDEAQHLMPEHVAGSGPAKLAHPNPQSWYAGSGGLEKSVKAWEMRRQALTGTGGRLSYTEHTAQIVSVDDEGRIQLIDPDPEDRDAWAQANPGLGRWVTEEGMDDMRSELGDLFLREGLCVWEPEPGTTDGPIDPQTWSDLTDANVTADDFAPGTIRLALDAPPDRRTATFSVAGKLDNGLLYVERREHLPPERMRDLVARAKELCAGHDTSLIIPSNSPALLAWRAELEAAGVDLDVMTPADTAAAFGNVLVAINEGTLRHRGQPEMTNAVTGLAVKKSGDVDVPARRNSATNIAPFIAAMCALYRVPEAKSTEIEAMFAVT